MFSLVIGMGWEAGRFETLLIVEIDELAGLVCEERVCAL
jgi:hypothetical protein